MSFVRFAAAVVVAATFFMDAGEAKSSVVIDIDRRLMLYNNDGDGMSYILTGDKKFSIRYSEENKYPLGANGQLRFLLDKDREVKAVLEKAGRPG